MVYHILKDGSRPKDIKGLVVKMEYATPLYDFMKTYKKPKNADTYDKYDKGKTKVS